MGLGTPAIGLMPAMTGFHVVDVKQPEWVSGVMSRYFLPWSSSPRDPPPVVSSHGRLSEE
ncbi:hypothetical protein SAM40697_0503 [Streptomyces ambofaciens]|uniref:Uncharacterized protein n=1 Tax=Streptomyces ambofaciens TaxID=1889 RepID=A0ABM6AT70_STRAM|nr:hypothetical protein SAM40697_0503 [Streptomyces ambofaciens]